LESRFSTAYGLAASVDKTFSILGNIAAKPIFIEFEWNKKPNHSRAVGFFKFVFGFINRSKAAGFVPKTNNQRNHKWSYVHQVRL